MFVTSTIWLPTEWHIHLSGPLWNEIGFQQFCTISVTYLVFMWSAYLKKCHIKLTCLTGSIRFKYSQVVFQQMMVCRCSKLVELAKPTQWSLQGTVNNEVLPIKVEKKGDTFEVN